MYGYEIFHEAVMSTLIDNLRAGRSANTYIFEGVKGLRKHQAALLFAKALVCSSPEKAPCCECSACIEAQAGTHPDIIHVSRDKDRATLGVEPIRNMITEANIKPFSNQHKIFIIDDGDLLTTAAQNAFLKIIEEPPEYAVFIILCTDAEILLQTVRSRAVIISFNPVRDDIVRDYIQTNYPDEPRTEFLIKYCAGIPETADNIIKRDDFEQLREETLGLVPKLLSKNKLHAFAVADYFDKSKANAGELYDMILLYLRDALVMSIGAADKLVNTDKKDKLQLLVSTYPVPLIALAIDEIVTAKKMQERYVKASAAALHAALKIHL